MNINHAVTFTGALTTDQTLDLMRHSNAFVLASRTETFGVVYIEALSQGLPVIATRCGGPESIVTSDNGLLVPIENIPELTKALLTLYENHAHYDPVRLRQDCLQQFGSRAIAQHLIDTFQKVLNK